MRNRIAVFLLMVIMVCPFLFVGCGESNDYIPIAEIVWEYDEVELMPGELFKLNYKVYPNNATETVPTLVNVKGNTLTDALKIDKPVSITYSVIDKGTLQILGFGGETEFVITIVYKAGKETKEANCVIKKRELPSSIRFDSTEIDAETGKSVYYLGTGQTNKLLVLDNNGKELDLSRYNVEFTSPVENPGYRVSDLGKGIIEAIREGKYEVDLKIRFAQYRESGGSGDYVYADRTTSCILKITDSYDTMRIYGTGGAVVSLDGKARVVSVSGYGNKIHLQFIRNNYIVELDNCKFNVVALSTDDLSCIGNCAVDSEDDEYVITFNSAPTNDLYFILESSIMNEQGVVYSELVKILR